MPSPFVLSIETAAGTHVHGFHLGTQEALARQIAEEKWFHQKARTVALIRDGKIFDVFYGNCWHSQLGETL